MVTLGTLALFASLVAGGDTLHGTVVDTSWSSSRGRYCECA